MESYASEQEARRVGVEKSCVEIVDRLFANRRLCVYLLNSRQQWTAKRSEFASFEETAYRCTCFSFRRAGHRASRLAPWRRRRHTQMTDFQTPLTCINLASPAAVASGGVQPIPIKAEGSATSEPDSRS